jgi:hypothetical protein
VNCLKISGEKLVLVYEKFFVGGVRRKDKKNEALLPFWIFSLVLLIYLGKIQYFGPNWIKSH